MTDRAATLIEGRRERLIRVLGRALQNPPADESPLAEEARLHLLEEAQDLYWNELEWEHLTEEEASDGEPLFELMFPGLLAFVRGLLLTETNMDALAPAEPRPQVVRDLLAFLAGRILEIEEAPVPDDAEDAARIRAELQMTDRLIDLVLYRYHGLHQEQIEQLEQARSS